MLAPFSQTRPIPNQPAPERAQDPSHLVRRGLVEHGASLVAHARRLTRDHAAAEDLVQDTSVRALAFALSFEPGSNVRAWLHHILHTVFITRCRRRTRERRALESLHADPCAWVRRDAEAAMQKLSPPVEHALSRLPNTFRDVVQLVDVLELSYRDAASELAVPIGTIMSRLHRGRRLLATALAGGGAEAPAQAA